MNYYVKRFITLIITLFIVTLLTFVAFSVIPGDAALTKSSLDASDADIEEYREALGLNDRIPVRFTKYIKGIIRGDFGQSIQYDMPVTRLIGDRLYVTIWLAIMAFAIIVVVSIPLGILSSVKQDGIIDRIISLVTQIFMAIPPFFLGIMISILFGLTFKLFIPGAFVPISQDRAGFFRYMIYPAIAIAIPKIAMTVKFLRTSIIRELEFDYVRTAKSKGSSNIHILFKHVLKNAMVPVITFLGMVAADVLAGSIIIEQVFNLPGIGRLLVTAISNRDYPVAQAIILYIGAIVISMNFIVDVAYQKLDPRVRIAE